jgi:hypothetical protein
VSSRKMGQRRSSRSLASSQATGMLTRSSTVCLQGGTAGARRQDDPRGLLCRRQGQQTAEADPKLPF